MRRKTHLFALVMAFLAVPSAALTQVPITGTAYPSFHAFLFGDVLYIARGHAQPEGFVIGQMVGHGNAHLSEHVSFFGEVSATGRADAYGIEVERAILRYDFADALKLSIGRYHTPVSYWNTAYHHGLWLQTSVARPEIIKIGGRFLPVHFVGAVAEGNVAVSGASISYEAGVGNGRGANAARGGDAGDVNRSRAGVVSARVRPVGTFGLQVGGSLYLDRVQVTTAGRMDERTVTGHVGWDQGAPELMLEYANVKHDPTGGGEGQTSEGWYAHFGLRLPGSFSSLKPYVRLERLEVDDADPYFSTQVADYRALLLGIRYDFSSLATAKAEYRREKFLPWDVLNSLYFQVAFALPLSGGM